MTPLEEWRAKVSAEAPGKVVHSLEFSEGNDGGPSYWVLTFTDGTEICFNRTMAEATASQSAQGGQPDRR